MSGNTNYNRPPSQWAHAKPAGSDVYWVGSDAGTLIVWHWCVGVAPGPGPVVDAGRWAAADLAAHTLVSLDPLHVEPSILWNCCGRHGFIRNGRWADA
jgi:hypothetical protein